MYRMLLSIISCFLKFPKVYKKAMENLLPTPTKSHYTFNLRDFSRVIQGCLLLRKESLENKRTMIRLFVHEVFRVYYDRLVDDKDRAWLYQLMKSIVKDQFKESFDQVFDHLKQGSKVRWDSAIFFLHPTHHQVHVIILCLDLKSILTLFENGLQEWSEDHQIHWDSLSE